MKLQSLRLNNFRQFFGEVFLEFGTEADKNISVVHGANGSGKTTLLNAFTWALYADFTPAFENPDDLLSRKAAYLAKKGEQVNLAVEVEFGHAGTHYAAKREQAYTCDNGAARKSGQEVFSVSIRDADGQTRTANDPVRLINRILPKYLYSYFFFDGERMNRISRQDAAQRKDIALAIKSLMGVEVLERAIAHLGGSRGIKGVKKHFESELANLGDPELDRYLKEKERIEDEQLRALDEKELLEGEIDAIDRSIQAIEEKLRKIAPAAEAQKRRDDLDAQLDSEKSSLENVQEELKRIVRSKGYLEFLGGASETCSSLIRGLSDSGQLPSGYKQSFIQRLLDDGVCVCRRDIQPGSQEETSLIDWRDRGGLADVEQRALYLQGFLGEYAPRRQEYESDLQDSLDRQAAIYDRIDHLEGSLEDIHNELRDINVEDVAALEENRRNSLAAKQAKNREHGALVQKLNNLGEEIEAINRKIETQQSHQVKIQKVQEQLSLVDETLNVIRQVRELKSAEVVSGLQAEIADMFGRISYKAHKPKLTKDYSLYLTEIVGGQERRVSASEGENQLLSLSFIGAVVKSAAEKSSSKDQWDAPGELPIVMDSPFGTLDENYVKPVANYIPAMAPQVILLASKKQWAGPAEDTMAPKIGRQYILRFHSKRPKIESHSITVQGTEYQYVVESVDDFEWTEVVEI